MGWLGLVLEAWRRGFAGFISWSAWRTFCGVQQLRDIAWGKSFAALSGFVSLRCLLLLRRRFLSGNHIDPMEDNSACWCSCSIFRPRSWNTRSRCSTLVAEAYLIGDNSRFLHRNSGTVCFAVVRWNKAQIRCGRAGCSWVASLGHHG